MPTADASQFTRLKKYSAIDTQKFDDPRYQQKRVTHLFQRVPSVTEPGNFLPSPTNKYISTTSFTQINRVTGAESKPRVPGGNRFGYVLRPRRTTLTGTSQATNGLLIVGFLGYDNRWANPAQGNAWWLNSQFGTLLFNTTLNGGNPWVYENTDYGDVFGYFRNLQAKGAKIILSFGGATGNIATLVPDSLTATKLGNSMAFLCTGSGSNPLNFPVMRDHTQATFLFDGIDFDLETQSATDTTTMTTLLSTLRTGAPSAVITCAPQPAYLFSGSTYPSAFNANGAYSAYASITALPATLTASGASAALMDANNIGKFTYVLMQYYNQTPDQYPGGANFANILAQLAYLAQSAVGANKPKIYIGLLSNIQGGSSPNPIPAASSLIAPIESGINAAQALLVTAGLTTISISTWLGGIMVWDSPTANDYGNTIVTGSTILTALPKPLVLYGGQEWSNTGPANPGW